jgi:hypothetical protein
MFTNSENKEVVRRYTESTNVYEFLIKFKVLLEQLDNSSVASVALDASNANGMPEEVKEFRMKKKTLRTETKYFD